jgi:hypothetical protein
MKRLLTAVAVVVTLAAASPAAAFDFPEQPDTNPGAEDNGYAAILGHPGVFVSTGVEAAPAVAIRNQIYVDACLGGP